MILVIGAESSGKRTYVETLGYRREQMADAVLDERPVVYNVQALVWRDVERAPELLEALCEKEVVVCNEVGCGVIPLRREDRAAREATGRLCVLLAQRAEKVVRMVCGIAAVIRGEEQ